MSLSYHKHPEKEDKLCTYNYIFFMYFDIDYFIFPYRKYMHSYFLFLIMIYFLLFRSIFCILFIFLFDIK